MAATEGSYIYRLGTTGQTETVVSTRFRIFSPNVNVGKFTQMGVTSSFGVQETREVQAIRGLGYGDQIAELVPGLTAPTTLSITRTALYLANLQQMLGYKAGASGLVRSLKHHKWPFDIKTEIVFSELASEDPTHGGNDATPASVNAEGGLNNYGNPGLYCIATVYEGCWLESYNTTFQADQSAVSEDCSVIVTDIFDISGSVYGDFENSGNNSGDLTGRSLLFSPSTTSTVNLVSGQNNGLLV